LLFAHDLAVCSFSCPLSNKRRTACTQRLQAQTQGQPHLIPLIPFIVSSHSAGRCLGRLCTSLVGVDFLAVLVVSNAGWRSTVAATFARADTNDLSMNGAGDAVLELQVHLWDAVFGEDGGIRDVTDSGRLDHVTDGESLDGLVFWCASRAIAASDGLDVSPSGLVTSVARSLLNHFVEWCGGGVCMRYGVYC